MDGMKVEVNGPGGGGTERSVEIGAGTAVRK